MDDSPKLCPFAYGQVHKLKLVNLIYVKDEPQVVNVTTFYQDLTNPIVKCT